MLAFAYVLDLLVHEFAGLRGRRLSFPLVLLRALQCRFVGMFEPPPFSGQRRPPK
jgi:hypothetical protein